jgi:hypothetical protein
MDLFFNSIESVWALKKLFNPDLVEETQPEKKVPDPK